jgi:hypothetical protein
MGKKLPPLQLELYKRIDEILFYKWDPIGISEMDWSRDEYQGYLPEVFKLTLEGNDPEPIEQYLKIIRTDNMGLSPADSKDRAIAKLILDIKGSIGL